MKRLDHAELQTRLSDALAREAVSIPAAVDTVRLADQIAGHLATLEIFDPDHRMEEGEALPVLPGFDLPELGLSVPDQAIPKSTIFTRWLLDQAGRREGWIGDLARAAMNDTSFPRDGDVDAARAWLDRRHASGDDYAALDDAEIDWLAL